MEALTSPNLAAVLLTALVFAWQALRYRRIGWLLVSLLLWLAAALLSALLLPEVAQIMENLYLKHQGHYSWPVWLAPALQRLVHPSTLYLMHGYLFAGSLFFWLGGVEKVRGGGLAGRRSGTLLPLYAFSLLVMHLAIALVVLAQWLVLSGSGLEKMMPVVLARAAAAYWLEPAKWLYWQIFLMVFFYLHNRLRQRRGDEMDSLQFVIALLASTVYFQDRMLGWLSRLLLTLF